MWLIWDTIDSHKNSVYYEHMAKNDNLMENMDENDSVEKEILDFGDVRKLLATADSYVEETRSDFETDGVPKKWIMELHEDIEKAQKMLSNLEIDHAEDVYVWRDPNGVDHDILLREQDPKAFDAFVDLYHSIEFSFDNYFRKHVALLKALKR